MDEVSFQVSTEIMARLERAFGNGVRDVARRALMKQLGETELRQFAAAKARALNEELGLDG